MTSRIASGPVRFSDGHGNRQDIDTTLEQNADGTYAPAAFGQRSCCPAVAAPPGSHRT